MTSEPQPSTPWYRIVIGLIGALAIGAALTIGVTTDSQDDGQGHHTTKRTVSIHVDTADPGTKPDDIMRVPVAAVAAAAATDVGNHDGLKSENPAGVTGSQLDAAQEQQQQLALNDQLPVIGPDAAPSQAGCRSRFIPYFSSRRGVAPRIIVWHYTVSPNTPGWGDVDGVTAFFSRLSTQANSNYVLDREGHCNYIVRESDKAWAQATFNPVAVSIEIINSGHEGSLISGAGEARLLSLTRDIAHRWKIPLRRGAVSGCTVTRSGIVTHQQLGACGGGHVDVSPYPVDGLVAKLAGGSTAKPAAPSRKVLTPNERKSVSCLESERRTAHRHGGWSKVAPIHNRRAVACKHQLQARSAELRKLGLTSKSNRAARYRILQDVIKAG